MTTEVIHVGGDIDFTPDLPKGAYSNYRENRGVRDIEKEFSEEGIPISFEGLLLSLRETFSTNPTLEVFDGGCGFGYTLRDLKDIARDLGIPLRTTGATNAQRNAETVVDLEVDTLYFGDIRSGFKRGIYPRSEYHLLIDHYGAAHRDVPLIDGKLTEGANVIPIYGHILAPGGIGITILSGLNTSSDDILPGRSNRVKKILSDNNFTILQHSGSFAVLQKEI